eukprot:CAMPEP_0172583976 /NCGR_PEP_ID=MMETSP1068-20121228/3548_1 /TAXON_ID=35684 /ORGANISM="Pseudopedinella elastica, Strain CCMP716" /LENGTH=245 /DNA_ID=CAMNT_0013377979 /DNA_START=6 /DNA_END=739 /DNA_ORIENTATION=-
MATQFMPEGPVDLTGGAKSVKNSGMSKNEAAMEELKAEMKLLNWHKLANESALKAALIRTKTLRGADSKSGGGRANMLQEKASWMAQVIDQEQRKPLQVTKDFVTAYALEEKRKEERLESEIERHIENLRRLRGKVAERGAAKERKAAYKHAAKSLKADQAMVGVVGGKKGGESGAPDGRTVAKSTLTTVINSLDRLVELEKRITGLENDSLLDRMGDSKAYPMVAAGHAADAVPSILGNSSRTG